MSEVTLTGFEYDEMCDKIEKLEAERDRLLAEVKDLTICFEAKNEHLGKCIAERDRYKAALEEMPCRCTRLDTHPPVDVICDRCKALRPSEEK